MWGPARVSTLGGNKYFVVFIDEYSRYCWLYLLKHKNDVIEIFNKWIKLVERQTENRVKMLRSDNAGELSGKEFQQILNEFGIVMEKTAPYSSNENGIAERKLRIIVEAIRCMIIQSGLPNEF